MTATTQMTTTTYAIAGSMLTVWGTMLAYMTVV